AVLPPPAPALHLAGRLPGVLEVRARGPGRPRGPALFLDRRARHRHPHHRIRPALDLRPQRTPGLEGLPAPRRTVRLRARWPDSPPDPSLLPPHLTLFFGSAPATKRA